MAFFWILICIGMAAVVSGCEKENLSADRACFKTKCIQVEIVQNDEDRIRGLQGRSFLGENQGMLFVFSQPGQYSFWMKDTLIPLDIIWMDYARRVVHIQDNAPPCLKDPCPAYRPTENALYVLEVNASVAKKIGIKTGDALEFYFKNVNGS